jgi:hypothetical protein
VDDALVVRVAAIVALWGKMRADLLREEAGGVRCRSCEVFGRLKD